MPRKQKTPRQFYYVYVMRYASGEVMARVQAGGVALPGDFEADVQICNTEYLAARALFRMVRAARRDPLAYQALVEVGNERIIDVLVKH
jgi:hypothetical protein